jgi:hypothetical protein
MIKATRQQVDSVCGTFQSLNTAFQDSVGSISSFFYGSVVRVVVITFFFSPSFLSPLNKKHDETAKI